MIDFGIPEHLDKSLKEDTGFSSPFRVFCFKPFPDSIYNDVVASLPTDEVYRELKHKDALRPDGTSTRTVLAQSRVTDPFLGDVLDTLRGGEVLVIFIKHLGLDQYVYPIVRLFRDYEGYKISPHPDSSKKAATVQFYLPEDDSQFNLGTSFYSKKADGSFEEKQKLPFLPNTGYGFKVTNHSWHGTDFQIIKKPRDSLIITYYKEIK